MICLEYVYTDRRKTKMKNFIQFYGVVVLKNIFISRRTFETCINSAVIHYNDGGDVIKSLLSYLGLL